MAKEVFKRTKPHVNVGTIGHIDHGKTTLTAAIVHRQAFKFPNSGIKVKSYKDIAKGGAERDEIKTDTIAGAHVEYENNTPHQAHNDCSGPAAYIKNRIHRAL